MAIFHRLRPALAAKAAWTESGDRGQDSCLEINVSFERVCSINLPSPVAPFHSPRYRELNLVCADGPNFPLIRIVEQINYAEQIQAGQHRPPLHDSHYA